jgi:hypothetical protein
MKTSIKDRDLTEQAPHSPRERFSGFAILARTTDKCRASINGKLGEYHFDCPLDNQLFSFKGINGDQFKQCVKNAKTYEEVAQWLEKAGTPKTAREITEWSDKMEALKLRDVPTMKEPEHKKEVSESCQKLGLDFETATLFEWLEADDQTVGKAQPELAAH